MATLLKSGGLFLHVPKTGGNWVSEVLEANDLVFAHVGGKHAGAAQLAPLEKLLHVPLRYDKPNRPLFRFCFVRHPRRWYESWFRMNVDLGWPDWAADEDAWNPSVELNGLGANTFNGFIDNVLRHRPGFLTHLFDYYARDAHFVGRQEHMVDDLSRVLECLGVTVPVETLSRQRPINVSKTTDVQLDPSLRRTLDVAEREAFVRYGYATDEDSATTPDLRTPLASGVPLGGRATHNGGFAWIVHAPDFARFADTAQSPRRSVLSLLEDGRPLGPAHQLHENIRRLGEGRLSHWDEWLLFSTSDNTDPNTNGRHYQMAYARPESLGSTSLLTTGDRPAWPESRSATPMVVREEAA
jgi:hypothetical protein